MKLQELKQDPRNANKGTERGRQTVRQSLRDCGTGRSIVVDKDGVILAGNKTAEAAIAERKKQYEIEKAQRKAQQN